MTQRHGRNRFHNRDRGPRRFDELAGERERRFGSVPDGGLRRRRPRDPVSFGKEIMPLVHDSYRLDSVLL